MNTEIEAKFLNIDHDAIRAKLEALGGVLEQPLRLMRRVVIHTPDMTSKNAFLRVRDEGYRTTITYKQFDSDAVDGAKEYEVEVSSFDDTVRMLSASGLTYDAYQESKRENWRLGNVEIMLDEWPWLQPYLEVEGESEEAIKQVAELLELSWTDAQFGGIANAYRSQYPHIGDEGITIINQQWAEIKFNSPAPALLTAPAVKEQP